MFDFISKMLKVSGKMTSQGSDKAGFIVALSVLIASASAGVALILHVVRWW